MVEHEGLTVASCETRITNLLYLYAERMDAGDLDGAAELFRHAEILVAGSDAPVDHDELRRICGAHVKIHACGTPRTKHVVSNPIVEVDDAGATASCRSYYTVLQAAGGLPLQTIAAGRYHDRFELVDGDWRFTFRDYRLLDLVGDISAHLLIPLDG